MKNMRKQLRLTLPKTSLTALNEAERASGQVWRIERTAVPVYRLLRDLEPDLQRDSLLNFAEACDADCVRDPTYTWLRWGFRSLRVAMLDIFLTPPIFLA